MAVRALTPDDVALYREIRLEALATDPHAFASTYEREAAFDEQTWRKRMVSANGRPIAVFVDELEGLEHPTAGTAGIGFIDQDSPPMLVAMWVRPTARGRGVGNRLIDAAVAWSRALDATEVVLWVVEDNDPAIGLYQRYGFVPTGRVATVPGVRSDQEREMRFSL